MKELTTPSSFRWDIRESYASIAAKIGVDEETVRRRVKRARESGFLKGWQVLLNPLLIGRDSAGIQLEVDDEKRKAMVISQIEQLDGVVIIVNFHGPGFRVIFYHKNEQDLTEKIRLFTSISGRKEVMLWKGGFPLSDAVLKRTDWEIVRALRKDPRRSPSEISGEVHVSVRTVKRRLDIMTKGLAFYLLPMLDYDKYPGVGSDFVIYCPDKEKKNRVDKILRTKLDRTIFSFTDAESFSIYAMICMNISEAQEIKTWIMGLDGVETVRLDTMRSNNIVKGWLDQEIDNRISVK